MLEFSGVAAELERREHGLCCSGHYFTCTFGTSSRMKNDSKV